MHRFFKQSLESLDDEIKIACKASGIDYKDAPEEFERFFKHVRILIEDERLPDVCLAELGTFKSTPSSIRKALRVYKMKVSTDYYKWIVSKIWYPYKRINNYYNGKGGKLDTNIVGAGYFWTYVPMKFASTVFPDLYNKIKDLKNKQ